MKQSKEDKIKELREAAKDAYAFASANPHTGFGATMLCNKALRAGRRINAMADKLERELNLRS